MEKLLKRSGDNIQLGLINKLSYLSLSSCLFVKSFFKIGLSPKQIKLEHFFLKLVKIFSQTRTSYYLARLAHNILKIQTTPDQLDYSLSRTDFLATS